MIAEVVGVVALNLLTGAFNLLAGIQPDSGDRAGRDGEARGGDPDAPGSLLRGHGRTEVRQQFRLVREDSGEHDAGYAEQFDHLRARQRVAQGRALASGDDQVRPARHAQLLGETGRFDAGVAKHLGNPVLAFAQQLQDADTDG